jgi:hypothetical protein
MPENLSPQESPISQTVSQEARSGAQEVGMEARATAESLAPGSRPCPTASLTPRCGLLASCPPMARDTFASRATGQP